MKSSSIPSSFSSSVFNAVPLKRIVKPELLDELPVDDPRAIRSRADLRRLNTLMRHAAIFCSALVSSVERPPQVIAEIGAGDGTLMLKIAAQMSARWPGVRAILVDKRRVITDATVRQFERFGWQAEVVTKDAFGCVASMSHRDVVMANLFLHHFEDDKLNALFRSLAVRTNLFVACETRRDWVSLAGSWIVGLLGCNAVTRHDAPASVEAGFAGDELSTLWPSDGGWKLTERRAGVFTHAFVALRTGR
jgi:hypothetical protein